MEIITVLFGEANLGFSSVPYLSEDSGDHINTFYETNTAILPVSRFKQMVESNMILLYTSTRDEAAQGEKSLLAFFNSFSRPPTHQYSRLLLFFFFSFPPDFLPDLTLPTRFNTPFFAPVPSVRAWKSLNCLEPNTPCIPSNRFREE